MKLLPLLSAQGLLLYRVDGFSPASKPTICNQPPAKRVAAPLLRGPAAAAAFMAPSTTRRPFTPKAKGSVEEGGTGADDKPFVRPALHNSTFFRALAILYALLFAVYQSSGAAPSAGDALRRAGKYLVLPPGAAATVHLLSFATWFGTVVYTTFVAGITMFKNLPRRVFGTLQSKLFPLYFRLCSAMIAVQILTLTAMPDVLSKTSEVSLAVAFFATLLNLLYLEPESTEVMFNRYSMEDEGKRDSVEYGKLAKSFGKLHGLSSLTNLIALCGGVVHGVRLASGLISG